MTLFIVIAALLAIGAAGATAWPLVSRKPAGPAAIDEEEERNTRLAEIEQDREFGLIDNTAADAMSLVEVVSETTERASAPDGSLARIVGFVVLASLPIIAAMIYLELGAPFALTEKGRANAAAAAIAEARAQMTPDDSAAAIAAMAPDERQQMIEGMVAGLAARLAEQPDDVEGWRMLARSSAVLGDTAQSAAAWREVVARSDNADDWRGFAAALLEGRPAGDEAVDAELEGALRKLLAASENDPLALFFLGFADAQKGEMQSAKARWEKLRSLLPPDSPLSPKLNELIAGAAAPSEKTPAQ